MSVTVESPQSFQRFEALKKANDRRSARVDLKERMRVGEVRIEDVLADPPEFLSSKWVCELLEFAPLVGRVRASRILRRSGVWPLRPVGTLTARERSALVDAVRWSPAFVEATRDEELTAAVRKACDRSRDGWADCVEIAFAGEFDHQRIVGRLRGAQMRGLVVSRPGRSRGRKLWRVASGLRALGETR